jgi:formate hydrogenlyase transcriptional activator
MSGFDENVFFREATLKICSALEVEAFLTQSLSYLRRFIPADFVFLSHYYPERREQLIMALNHATRGDDASIITALSSMPEEARRYFSHSGERAHFATQAKSLAPARPWMERGFLNPDDAMLVCRLRLGEKLIGAVGFGARGSDRFTQKHARLLEILREPFAVALSNSLRYREILELKEQTAAPCFSMRSESSLWTPRCGCCGFSRKKRSSASAAPRPES